MDVTTLEADVQRYFEQGLAQSTQKTYKSGIKKFYEFCARLPPQFVSLPITQSMLCLYVSYLARSGLSYSTINSYLSALRHLHILHNFPEPQQAAWQKFMLVKRGIRKEKAISHPQKPRLPITPDILRQIKALWSVEPIQPDTVMLWAASCLCFFGFFRLGEITCSSANAVNHKDLLLADLAVDSHAGPTYISVTLKQSKTDQFRRGALVIIGRTDDDLCPVAALLQYIAIRGTHSGPLFIYADGKFLTKQSFVPRIREALSALGLNNTHYAGHSFRIGAASTAAKANIEDSMIKTLGRWESSAFLTYIRTPPALIARMAKTLSSPTTD